MNQSGKNAAVAVVTLLGAAFGLAGCAQTETPGQPGNAESRITVPTSALASPNQTTQEPSSRQIVGVVEADASLKHYYPTVESLVLAPEVEFVVAGTVTSVEFRQVDGLAYTAFQVEVSEEFRSKLDSGVIEVWEDGGLLPVSALDKSDLAKFPEADQIRESLDGLVDYQFMGADHPTPGQDVTLFLYREPRGPGGADVYYEVGSVFGRFTKQPDGTLIRAGQDSAIEDTVEAATLTSWLTE